MKKTVYARVEEDLFNRIHAYSQAQAATVSASIEHLVERGLSAVDSAQQAEKLAGEAATLKEESRKLREENASLAHRLQICEKNEALALAACSQAELLKTQFEQVLGLGVATCGRPGCNQVWRMYDVWRHQCPRCGSTTSRLRNDYTPVGENVRDILAVFGGASALVALLKAMRENNIKA